MFSFLKFQQILCLLSTSSSAKKFSFGHRTTDEIVHLPYYGGATGQTLEIVQKKDGSITSSIIRNDDSTHVKNQGDLEMKFQNIQQAAAQLVAIQENAKNKGTFSSEDNKAYAQNLQQLGVAAQELAQLQQSGQSDIHKLLNTPEGQKMQATLQNAAQKLDFVNTADDHVDDVNTDLDPNVQQDPDTVQVSVPNKDAAVAEAKPVGLSIAGESGVASSKPVGTAISGGNGLAVSRPVATAIAGISPSEVAALGLPIPNRIKKISLHSDAYQYRLRNDGYLAGPLSNASPLFRIAAQPEQDHISDDTDDTVIVEKISQITKDNPLSTRASENYVRYAEGRRQAQGVSDNVDENVGPYSRIYYYI